LRENPLSKPAPATRVYERPGVSPMMAVQEGAKPGGVTKRNQAFVKRQNARQRKNRGAAAATGK